MSSTIARKTCATIERTLVLALLLAAAIAGPANADPWGAAVEPSRGLDTALPGRTIEPGRVIVRARAGADKHRLRGAIGAAAGTVVKEFESLGMLVVSVNPSDEESLSRKLAPRSDVSFATPCYRYHLTLIPNDAW